MNIFIDIGEMVSNFNVISILEPSPTNLNVTGFYPALCFKECLAWLYSLNIWENASVMRYLSYPHPRRFCSIFLSTTYVPNSFPWSRTCLEWEESSWNPGENLILPVLGREDWMTISRLKYYLFLHCSKGWDRSSTTISSVPANH